MTEVPLSRFRWFWYAGGLAMIAWGALGLWQHGSTRDLTNALRFAVVGLAGHDAFFAPVAFVVAYATARLLPTVVRTPVRVGLAISVVLLFLAFPMIRSDNRLRSPSVLPLPYERNLAILLGLVFLGVVVGILAKVRQQRRISRVAAPERNLSAPQPG